MVTGVDFAENAFPSMLYKPSNTTLSSIVNHSLIDALSAS
jgi:hypothetical protein